jgi:hypothetical protein
MSARLCLIVVFWCVPSTAAIAQLWPIPVGARVRVWNERDRLSGVLSTRGIVLGISPDTLLITEEWTESPLAIPMASVSRIDVSRGVIPRRTGILRGAKRGFVVGVMASPLLILERRKAGDGGTEWLKNVAYSLAISGAHGAAVGGFLGTTLRHTRWERVPEPIASPPSDSTGSRRR